MSGPVCAAVAATIVVTHPRNAGGCRTHDVSASRNGGDDDATCDSRTHDGGAPYGGAIHDDAIYDDDAICGDVCVLPSLHWELRSYLLLGLPSQVPLEPARLLGPEQMQLRNPSTYVASSFVSFSVI